MNSKFVTAQMQRFTTNAQKLKQSEYKSTYKYFKPKEDLTSQDLFVKIQDVQKKCSQNAVRDILTGKYNKNRK